MKISFRFSNNFLFSLKKSSMSAFGDYTRLITKTIVNANLQVEDPDRADLEQFVEIFIRKKRIQNFSNFAFSFSNRYSTALRALGLIAVRCDDPTDSITFLNNVLETFVQIASISKSPKENPKVRFACFSLFIDLLTETYITLSVKTSLQIPSYLGRLCSINDVSLLLS